MLALFTSESSVPGYVMAHSGCSINVVWTVIFEESASEPQWAFMVGGHPNMGKAQHYLQDLLPSPLLWVEYLT